MFDTQPAIVETTDAMQAKSQSSTGGPGDSSLPASQFTGNGPRVVSLERTK